MVKCSSMLYEKKIEQSSDIVDAVLFVSERNPFHAEVGVNNQVSAEDFGWHYLALLCINYLLPRVGGVWHYKAEVEAKRLNDLTIHAHHLLD